MACVWPSAAPRTGACQFDRAGQSRSATCYLCLLPVSTPACATRPDIVWMVGGHSSAIGHLALSRDGQTLASGSWDNTIKLWRVFGRGRTENDEVDLVLCGLFLRTVRLSHLGGNDSTSKGFGVPRMGCYCAR